MKKIRDKIKAVLLITSLLLFLSFKNSDKIVYNFSLKAIKIDSNKITERIGYAEYLHVNFKWGGSSKHGYDCSGLVKKIYKDFDTSLPHHAATIAKLGKKVSFDSLQYGDLLFFRTQRHISHIALYIGHNKIIQATVHNGVKIDSFNSNVWRNYWSRKYVFSKRLKIHKLYNTL